MTGAKSKIFEQLADLGRVLGHANRLELLEHISQGERSVERLAEVMGLSVALTSAQVAAMYTSPLSQLRSAQLFALTTAEL